jgi:hypothetical protein
MEGKMARSTFKLFRILIILSLVSLNSFIFLNDAASVSAGSISHPCFLVKPVTASSDGPIAPMVLPAGTPPEDADWLVESQEMHAQKDASGKSYTTTVTVRRNPHPVIPKSDDPASLSAAAASCAYDSTKSDSVTTRSADGGLAQTLTNYYYRYTYSNGSQTWWAYYTYKTEISYTRTNSTYTLGQNTTTWNFLGADCSGVVQHYTSTGGMIPTWSGNSTSLYYWTFMNQWSTLSPGSSMNLITNASTIASHSGVGIAPLNSQIIYRRTGL